MNLTISILGCEVFAIRTEAQDDDERGDAVSMPVGFVASAGDQRYERGVDFD